MGEGATLSLFPPLLASSPSGGEEHDTPGEEHEILARGLIRCKARNIRWHMACARPICGGDSGLSARIAKHRADTLGRM